MTASEQYDYSLSLEEGAKFADNLVKTGFSSKTDAFLKQLCLVEEANDDVVSDLLTRELIFKKIIDAVVVARKPLTDEDKTKMFEYISEALKLQMNPQTVGINDQVLAHLVIENNQNPSATQHNADILQLAQQLEEDTAFFELTAAKCVQFDESQSASLTERCLALVQAQQNPKGVVYALALVNLEQVGMAMTILSALSEKGCATDMASFVHRLLPYVEGDDIENLLELLQQNLLQQQEVFEQPALYDHTARVYLQAVRSFAESGFYQEGAKIIEFLQQNQRLDGFDDEVQEVRQFVEEVKQKHIADEQQAARLQAKVEAAKAAVEEAKAIAEAEAQAAAEAQAKEQEEASPVIEAEVISSDTVENVVNEENIETVEENSVSENISEIEAVDEGEETNFATENVEVSSSEEQFSEETSVNAYEEQSLEAENVENMATEENYVAQTPLDEYTEQPLDAVNVVDEPQEEMIYKNDDTSMGDENENLSFEQRMAAADNRIIQEYATMEEEQAQSLEQPMDEAQGEAVQEYATMEGEQAQSLEQSMDEAQGEAVQEYVTMEGEPSQLFEQYMAEAQGGVVREQVATEVVQNQPVEQPVAEVQNEVIQEQITTEVAQNQTMEQPVEEVQNEVVKEPVVENVIPETTKNKSFGSVLKSKLFGKKLENVGEKVSSIKDNINNTLGINSDNLDKGLNIIKDVTTSAIKIAGEQTEKVKQKVEDLVKNDENQNNIETNVADNEVEGVVADILTENTVSEAPAKSATPVTPQKVVSTFYEVPFWERENAEELEQREQALKQFEQGSDEQNSVEQNPFAMGQNTFGAENNSLNDEENPFAANYAEQNYSMENVQNTEAESTSQSAFNPLVTNRIEERIDERQEELAEQNVQKEALSNEPEQKPNFDDIDLSKVSNYSSLDDFGFQIGEDLDEKK